MDNLWILTEERPKVSVLVDIIELYCKDFNDEIIFCDNPKIEPIYFNDHFTFVYLLNGVKLKTVELIYIESVSGESSFFDFLVVKQKERPIENYLGDNLLMAIEETKTSDKESRNTGVYQRASKFVYLDIFTTRVKKYMLYNDELDIQEDTEPSDTSKFGTNMLLTQKVKIVGKETDVWFEEYTSIDDLIAFKNSMKKPPASNTPITITKFTDRIELTGLISKPADKGNMAHDPNIGAISCICKTLRDLGWDKKILLKRHGIQQFYIDRLINPNKFLSICKHLQIQIDGIVLNDLPYPTNYWYYERTSEKIASILLHIESENNGIIGIYQNHAGCERGYFKAHSNQFIVLPKKDRMNNILSIPDLILLNEKKKEIYIIEGKQYNTLAQGVIDIENYGSIIEEFIKPNYHGYAISRWITIFGGNLRRLPHESVMLCILSDGSIIVNKNAPTDVKEIFKSNGYFL